MNYFTNYDKLDSDMQGVVERLMSFNPPPIENLDFNAARNNPTFKNAIEEMAANSATARTMNVAMPTFLPARVAKIEHVVIPTRGGELNARVYRYDEDAADAPVIVYFHGGGWVIADLNVYDASCRALCNAAEAIVVSVAYRQAPEAKFPAAHDDAYYATQWVLQNTAWLGGDASRVAVAGESAGGNMAAATCLRSKEEGSLMPVAQLLVYPVAETSMSQASYAENEDTQPLHSSMMPWFMKYYLESDADKTNKYLTLVNAGDLSGLPPAIVITAEFDPLRDEGEQFAQSLADAGVSVKAQRFTGVTHEFFGLAGAVSKAADAVKFAAEGLKEVFDVQRSNNVSRS